MSGASELIERVNTLIKVTNETNQYLGSLYQGLTGMQADISGRLDQLSGLVTSLADRPSGAATVAAPADVNLDLDLDPVVNGFNDLAERIEAMTDIVVNLPDTSTPAAPVAAPTEVDFAPVLTAISGLAESVSALKDHAPAAAAPDLAPITDSLAALAERVERLQIAPAPVVAGDTVAPSASLQAIAASIDARLIDAEGLVARFDARVAELVAMVSDRADAPGASVSIDPDAIVNALKEAIAETQVAQPDVTAELAAMRAQLAAVGAGLAAAFTQMAAEVAVDTDDTVEEHVSAEGDAESPDQPAPAEGEHEWSAWGDDHHNGEHHDDPYLSLGHHDHHQG